MAIEQMAEFLVAIRICIATLVRCALAEVCSVPMLLVTFKIKTRGKLTLQRQIAIATIVREHVNTL